MAYVRKTYDLYILLTNYGYGWEDEVYEYSNKEIKKRYIEYSENTPARLKIIKRRKPKEKNL